MVNIQWPKAEPLDVEFTLRTTEKKNDVANVIIRTPWTSSQPSLTLDVDVDNAKNQGPVVVKVRAETAGKSVSIDVDAAVDSMDYIVAKTIGIQYIYLY